MKTRSRIMSKEGNAPVLIFVSTYNAYGEAESLHEMTRIDAGTYFDICLIRIDDWDRNLTPWEAKDAFRNRKMEGKANELLDYICKTVIPRINRQIPNHKEIYIAGYSLAGLFSLWAMYESDLFDGVACCSGSLWYPGWDEYISSHNIRRQGAKVYLSLGKDENKSRHPLIRNVQEITTKQYELLNEDENVASVKLYMNEGGHFNNVDERVETGVAWLLTGKICNI